MKKRRSGFRGFIRSVRARIKRKARRHSYNKGTIPSPHSNREAYRSGARLAYTFKKVGVHAVFIVAGLVLLVILIGNGLQGNETATLVTPVYSSLSVSQGMTADVVADIQQKLMDLGYMDQDQPDGIYGARTDQAVQYFQTQEDLPVTGTVDQQTYDLLFSYNTQEYVISLGANNQDVSDLQEQLYQLGYLEEGQRSGTFDEDTEAAVLKFQKRNGLTQSGTVNMATKNQLYSDDVIPNAYSYGENSPEIKTYQQRLKDLGYLTTTPDGNFGADTKAAVQRFQQNNGLIVDGWLGPNTIEVLMSSDALGNALSIGVSGTDVTNLQKRLKELGYMSRVTGYFGSETDTAVRSFQYNSKITVDGQVGKTTMNLLMSSKAKKSTGVLITGANVQSLIAVATSKLGCKYVSGGKGPNVFDCSGFVYWCINEVGIKQSYLTSSGWPYCTKYTKITKMSQLQKGDIICYKGHMTICAGGGYQLEASSSNGKVIKRKYAGSSYWSRNFVCAFRIF